VNKKQMRTKFEEVFSEDIEAWEQKRGKKRKSDVGPRVGKKTKPDEPKGLLATSPQPLELGPSKLDNIDGLRYNSYDGLTRLLRDVFSKYNSAPLDARVTMKRKVKNWLKTQLGDKFQSCRMTIPSGDNDKHQTYCVPRHLHVQFKDWAAKELTELGLI
jgi:hypothetical protein